MRSGFKYILVLAVAGCSAFWIWWDLTFIERNLTLFTGVETFATKYKYHDNHQTFIEVLLPVYEKRKVLERFAFDNDLSELKGRVESTFIAENPDFQFYVFEDGDGPMGYRIVALEERGNTMMFYDGFGN